MDYDQAITELVNELDAVNRQLEPLQQEAAALEAGIAAMKVVQQRRAGTSTTGDDVDEATDDSGAIEEEEIDPQAPRGAEAVGLILNDYPPGRWVDLRQLVADFEARGWGPASKNPREAVRASANRWVASNKEEFERGRSKYRRRPRYTPVSPSTNGGGVGARESVEDGQNSVFAE